MKKLFILILILFNSTQIFGVKNTDPLNLEKRNEEIDKKVTDLKMKLKDIKKRIVELENEKAELFQQKMITSKSLPHQAKH